jgi:hypothetical protein
VAACLLCLPALAVAKAGHGVWPNAVSGGATKAQASLLRDHAHCSGPSATQRGSVRECAARRTGRWLALALALTLTLTLT